MQTLKTSLSEQRALTDATLSAQSASEVNDLQSQQWLATVKKTFAYWRHLESIAVETQSDIFGTMQEHIGLSINWFADTVDTATAGLAAQARVKSASLIGAAQHATHSSDRVAIVDSNGGALSTDK